MIKHNRSDFKVASARLPLIRHYIYLIKKMFQSTSVDFSRIFCYRSYGNPFFKLEKLGSVGKVKGE